MRDKNDENNKNHLLLSNMCYSVFYILSNMWCLTILEIPNCDVNMFMRQLHRHENLRFSRLISS